MLEDAAAANRCVVFAGDQDDWVANGVSWLVFSGCFWLTPPLLLWPAGIRQLQLMLLKVALLLGIEIHVNVEFKGLIEPPEDQETESKFYCRFTDPLFTTPSKTQKHQNTKRNLEGHHTKK